MIVWSLNKNAKLTGTNVDTTHHQYLARQ